MREIKFRAWQNGHERMRTVRSIEFDASGNVRWVTINQPNTAPLSQIYGTKDYPLSYIDFMQYTGLIDKNGKEKEIAPKYNKEVSDPFGRFHFGIPPRGYADLAFLQHMISVLKQNGRLGVVLPHGTLFRGNSEGKIRKKILQNDLIEGIVGLPPALFYNTGIPASIWILNKKKPEHMKNTLKIIDASGQYKEGRNQNELLDEHIDKIVQAYDEERDVDKFMRLVDMDEVVENDYNLNISRYIDTTEPEPEVDLVSVREDINQLEENEKEIDDRLNQYLEELGL